MLAYLPALRGGFIWDDAGHVTRHDLQSAHGLSRIWFEVGATQQYYPFLHTAFWIEHRLWGDSPLGYHLVNVLLHATAACLLGLTLRKLAIPGAWLAALLFSLHPVCVESVAWIAEQKNTLSAVFYLCAARAFLQFDERRGWRAYAIATGCFLLALLTKTVTATLPAALLVIAWWRRGRLSWRDARPLLPWFVFGAAAGWMTAWFERTSIGAQGSDFALNLGQRCLLAGRATGFYLGKLVWPADLVFIYPRWNIDASVWWQWLFPLGMLVVLVSLWAWKVRGPLAGGLFFVGTLLPALGFFNVFPFVFSYVADHFQYLACTGILALTAAGLVSFLARFSPWVGRTTCLLLLAVLGTLTWAQSGIYRDVFTLYQATLERNPACWLAQNNLAEALTESGRPLEAIPLLEAALRLRPDFALAENNLGDDLRRVGRPEDGIPHLQRALHLQPGYPEAHNNLGVAFMMTGRGNEGVAELEKALQLQPDYPVARYNLGLARADTGHPAEAIAEFAEAVRLKPDYGDAELSWGIILTAAGRLADALPHFDRAIAIEPDSASVRCSCGRALAEAGHWERAIGYYEQALLLDPGFAEAHFNLALALRKVGRLDEAKAHDLESRRPNPHPASDGN